MLVNKSCPTMTIFLFVTGKDVEEHCQNYCDKHGLCVTITKTNYIFTGGSEEGYIIGLINYPRFPVSQITLEATAVSLGEYLFKHSNPNGSYTIQGPRGTIFVSNRPQDKGI